MNVHAETVLQATVSVFIKVSIIRLNWIEKEPGGRFDSEKRSCHWELARN